MTLAELHALAATTVGAAQRQLPPELRPLARGVAVHYEAKPHPDLIAEGQTLMLSAIKAYEVCKSFNEWPAYPTEVITIARPQSTAAIAPINFA